MPARKYPLAALFAVLGLIAAIFAFTTPASAYPPGSAASVGSSSSTVGPGGSFTVSGRNFKGVVTITGSDPIFLARVTAGADGTFSARVTLPAKEFPPGSHIITATDTFGDEATFHVTVASAAVTTTKPGSGLPFTGFAAGTIGGIGVLLLLGGGFLLLAGRRRNATV